MSVNLRPRADFVSEEGHKRKTQFHYLYDFSVDGGAVSTITLKDPDAVALVPPANILFDRYMIYVITAVTSAGAATLAFDWGATAGGILAATGKASFAVDAVLSGFFATPVKSDGTDQPKLTIATAALTAGKLILTIEGEPYVPPTRSAG